MVSLNFIKETGNSFFEDKIRKTDFVLVVSRVSAHENEKIITKYLKNAQAAGLEMEQVYGITEPVVFIKIHLPQETYDYLDTAWPLWNITRNVKHKVMKRRWYRNHLSYMDPRMGVDYLGKVYFIAKLLNRTKYGKRVMDKGINKLLSKKIFLHAFPLHDGGVESFELPDQKMNDLTLLAKYWDNVPALFKEPPLDMIKKYYGLEIAFYFAWLGFYKRMLIFPLILSICTLLAIFVEYVFMFEEDFKNLCRAEKIRMCRYCIQSWKLCEFDDLYEQCVSMKISLVVDNIVPFTYGSVMSAWAGVTVGLWKQREKYLRTRWNVGRDEIQLEERFEFRDEVIFRRKSKLTGFTEAFKPMSYSLFLFIGCFLLTAVVCLSLVTLILFLLQFCIYIKLIVARYTKEYVFLFTELLAAFIHSIIMRLIRNPLDYATGLIVKLYRCKYRNRYENSFLYLSTMFRFINENGIIYYLAYLKGKSYHIPQNRTPWALFFTYEQCQPHTCIIIISLLYLIMSCTRTFSACLEVIRIITKKEVSKLSWLAGAKIDLPQHEKEYKLSKFTEFVLPSKISTLMILHAYILCFATANLLGPLIAFSYILIRQYVDCRTFIYHSQRPIPKIVGGIDSLNQILLWFTCISVLSNSMASVITSHFLALLNYRISRGTFVGFFENALSLFAVEDMMGDAFRNETCWYRDLRFGPYAGNRKYEHDPKYFQQMYTNCMYVGIQQFSVITLYYIFNKAVELYQEMTTEKYDEKYDILDQTKN